MMNNSKFLTILTVVLWSFGAVLGRMISEKSQFILLSFSFTFTFITLFIYSFFVDKKNLVEKIRSIEYKFCFLGLFGYFFYWLGYIQSFRAYNSASEPTILNYTWPVFTVVFTETLFRRKTIKSKRIYVTEGVGIITGFLSVFLLITQGNMLSFHFQNGAGLAWGLLAGCSYGFFSAFSGTVSANKQSIFLLSSVFASLVVMLPISFSERSLISTLTFKDILIAAILGSVVDGVGYILWTRANRVAKERKENISSIASIIFILPILSLIIITLLFKEKVFYQEYFAISLLMIIISFILCRKSNTVRDFSY